ncbi:MAG: hypothetical protein ACRDVE_20445 [Actinocrinis sp.]
MAMFGVLCQQGRDGGPGKSPTVVPVALRPTAFAHPGEGAGLPPGRALFLNSGTSAVIQVARAEDPRISVRIRVARRNHGMWMESAR